jgi:hypothetical protein
MTEREFITLNKYPDYEITTEEPWQIRRKRDGKVLKQRTDKDGFLIVALEQVNHGLHRVVAEQFIPNPNNFPQIDHCDRQRTNNSLWNLRWVSCKTNRRNRISNKGVRYEYLDTLPEGFIPFTEYVMKTGEIHEFDDLFIKIENGIPTFITNESKRQYRVLREQPNRHFVSHHDINSKQVSICFSRINKAQTQLSETQATIAETQKQIAEAENNLSKAILNLTEIIKTQQTHREEETSDEEYEHFEPEDDYKK